MTELNLGELRACLEGVVPAVVATASAGGTPNITYLSRVYYVDDDHVALSNQFFSKTTRNLAENPKASMLIVSPRYEQYRMSVLYERTERQGPIFDGLRREIEAIATLSNMQDVFKLKAADVYRVVSIEQYPRLSQPSAEDRPAIDPFALGELAARMSRCHDLDALVNTALDGLEELFGYTHSLLMLRDEQGSKLYTIASHGYEDSGVGSEVAIGEGVLGMAAARCAPMRVGNLGQMRKYSESVRRSFEEHGAIEPGREIPLPTFPRVESQLAAPAIVRGQLLGVVAIESSERAAFDDRDEALLVVIAGLIGSAIEIDWAYERTAETPRGSQPAAGSEPPSAQVTRVRYFPADGSTFLGSEYLIKGVAGQILWSLLGHYTREGRVDFTNREVRLDPTLELPEFRDNLENRLLLLTRRLEEREAPIRIEKTGRGRFRLVVTSALQLERVR